MAPIAEKNIFRSDDTDSTPPAPPRALVVDDDYTTLKIVCHMLKAIGFQVESADGGVPAMHCLSQSAYDVLVTDLKMPDMDGYALSGWLKHNAPDTKVIIMTGCSRSELANYINTKVVDCWIYKPFGLNDLSETLRELVPLDKNRCPA